VTELRELIFREVERAVNVSVIKERLNGQYGSLFHVASGLQ
jgi:hypothetical protein